MIVCIKRRATRSQRNDGFASILQSHGHADEEETMSRGLSEIGRSQALMICISILISCQSVLEMDCFRLKEKSMFQRHEL